MEPCIISYAMILLSIQGACKTVAQGKCAPSGAPDDPGYLAGLQITENIVCFSIAQKSAMRVLTSHLIAPEVVSTNLCQSFLIRVIT